MKKITPESTFESSINSSSKVIVEFSAEWCGPCRTMKPILEEISKETDISVFEVDVDEDPELAERFNIRNIPTTLYFKDGQLFDKTVGSKAKNKIIENFNE